jgi:hypothetical protein
MQGRTFFRIMMDNLFVNNAFCRALSALVNFCNEQTYFSAKKLKFSKKMSLNKIEEQREYKTRFIFDSTIGVKNN